MEGENIDEFSPESPVGQEVSSDNVQSIIPLGIQLKINIKLWKIHLHLTLNHTINFGKLCKLSFLSIISKNFAGGSSDPPARELGKMKMGQEKRSKITLKGGRGLKNASLWAIISKKNFAGVFRPPR